MQAGILSQVLGKFNGGDGNDGEMNNKLIDEFGLNFVLAVVLFKLMQVVCGFQKTCSCPFRIEKFAMCCGSRQEQVF